MIQNAADTITVPGDVNIGSITFGSGGPYTLNFHAGALHLISGGTVSSQSTLTINVPPATTAEIDSTIIGAGELVTSGTGTLIVASAANSYSGGTDVAYGTLQLQKDPNLLTGCAFGHGPVTIGQYGVLDLNGCPLTDERPQRQRDDHGQRFGRRRHDPDDLRPLQQQHARHVHRRDCGYRRRQRILDPPRRLGGGNAPAWGVVWDEQLPLQQVYRRSRTR